ncbi:S49 family peptidase [Ancylobacter sp. 6x-1]|uniref:S49 family peptidase n=1 Tax=Ancylobacter crimeensis TaxID=2579147 RepID=A0ABT0DFQ4_9HYPH|nr:S49 family peptidase [Ancylobacter crimeensis]MCK0198788.1 S49 family peptidase [Ancylobacter crimeensis]
MSDGSLFSRFRRGLEPLLPARMRSGITVPVVRLHGAIGMATPLRPGITFSGVAKALERAFAVKGAKAVALLINSPGGSPVQSHLVFRRIRALAQEKEIPVFAFVEDVAASGGYMLACAADEIVADRFSIVGSIGVVSAGFGFNRAIDKLGIDRRVYTAGTRKVILDPFQPEHPEDVAKLKTIQREIHEQFVDLVKERRGGVLSGSDDTLFSGEFWASGEALEHGLIDAVGDMRSFLRARYGEKVETPLIETAGGWFGRRRPGVGALAALEGTEWFSADLAPFGSSVGAGLADRLVASAEERALWGRYGL